jgi:hypothetical protein
MTPLQGGQNIRQRASYQGELSLPHLFPQDDSWAKYADSVKARTKQANKRDDKQDDVSEERDDDVRLPLSMLYALHMPSSGHRAARIYV